MDKLFHISTTNKYLTWFDDDWDQIKSFAEKHHMDGVELGLTADYDISKIPEGIVKGVHLSFYPMWLEFWKGDLEKVKELLGTEEDVMAYYQGLDRNIMIESYKRQYERAKAIGAKYMVFHVSHIRPEDSFTWKFSYTDEEIMQATAELINEVFPGNEEGPLLLFENLWWPGLTYLDKALCKSFIEAIQYPNKGYLLDISHLVLTNKNIDSEIKCYTYIKKVLDNLGEIKSYIKGVHLNKTLPKRYINQDHSYRLQKYREGTNKAYKHRVLMEHVNKLDPHQPFDHPIALEIIKAINPEYCVYETNPESRYELAYFIKKQNQALGIEY